MGAYGSPQLGIYSETNESNNNNTKRKDILKYIFKFIYLGFVVFLLLLLKAYSIEINRLNFENTALQEQINRVKENSVLNEKAVDTEIDDTLIIEEENTKIENKQQKQINETVKDDVKEIILDGAGNYYVGKDFKEGVYDVEYISGSGMANGEAEYKDGYIAVSTLIHIQRDLEGNIYEHANIGKFKGAVLKDVLSNDGTKIKIDGNLKIKLIPVE